MKPIATSAAAPKSNQINVGLERLAVERYDEIAGQQDLPPLTYFDDGLAKLSPAHDFLSRHELEIGEAYKNAEMDLVFFRGDEASWDVGLISASEQPLFNHVSPDGMHGEYAEQTWRDLLEIPVGCDLDDLARQDVIMRFSPTVSMYKALQSARIEKGKRPVDLGDCIRSIAKTSLLAEAVGVLTFSKEKNRVVHRQDGDPTHHSVRMGVRLSIASSDIAR